MLWRYWPGPRGINCPFHERFPSALRAGGTRGFLMLPAAFLLLVVFPDDLSCSFQVQRLCKGEEALTAARGPEEGGEEPALPCNYNRPESLSYQVCGQVTVG